MAQTMSRHQKPCRDTTSANNGAFRLRHQELCRDTLVDVLPRHENHVATQNHPGPLPSHVATQNLMSRPGGQGILSRAHQDRVARTAALSLASCSVVRMAYAPCRTHQALPIATSFLGRDPAPKMSSSPSPLLPTLTNFT